MLNMPILIMGIMLHYLLSYRVTNDDDFIGITKVFNYDQKIKLTFNYERPGGGVDLQKGERVSLWCLHDNPLTIQNA